MKVYFKEIEGVIIENINNTKSSIKIAVTWFTNEDIYNTLFKKLKEGVKIQLIIINDGTNNAEDRKKDWQKLIDNGAEFYYSDIIKKVHHKFCIIDEELLITGSYNWTYGAKKNWENIFLIDDEKIVNEFCEEFKSIIDDHQKISIIEDRASNQNSYDNKTNLKNERVSIKLSNKHSFNIKICQITYDKYLKLKEKYPDKEIATLAAIDFLNYNFKSIQIKCPDFKELNPTNSNFEKKYYEKHKEISAFFKSFQVEMRDIAKLCNKKLTSLNNEVKFKNYLAYSELELFLYMEPLDKRESLKAYPIALIKSNYNTHNNEESKYKNKYLDKYESYNIKISEEGIFSISSMNEFDDQYKEYTINGKDKKEFNIKEWVSAIQKLI